MTQLELSFHIEQNPFGGILNSGRRKTHRPLIAGTPIHTVLKAVDDFSLLKHGREIEHYIRQSARKFQIDLRALAIHVDHIHLLPVLSEIDGYAKWIRAVTGVLSRKFKIKWRLPPFTKVVNTQEYLQNLERYFEKNRREGQFIVSAHDRVAAYTDWVDSTLLGK